MERDKIESLLNSGNEPMSSDGRRKLLAEFDRLKLRVAALAADLWDANAALDEAQSWLRTISEPIKKAREEVASGKSWCGTFKYATESQQAVFAYLDSQKPSEPPFPEHPCDACDHWDDCAGCTSPPKAEDCPICNPKHLCNDGIWEYIPKSECQRCSPPKCEHKNAGMK